MEDISNTQRAFWMVVTTSLAAPFFGAIAAMVLREIGELYGLLLFERDAPSIGDAAIAAYAWSALPATIAALGLLPYVLQSGTYSWLHAAIAGVLAFGACTIIAPIGAGPAMPLLAFLAGLVAVAMRAVLVAAKVLRGGDT